MSHLVKNCAHGEDKNSVGGASDGDGGNRQVVECDGLTYGIYLLML